MVDDRPEDNGPLGPLPDSGRPKRAPPTIDLAASEVTSETQKPANHGSENHGSASLGSEGHGSESPVSESSAQSESAPPPPSSSPSPWLVAVISGAIAASLVIGIGWMLGWPAVQSAAPAAPQVSAAAIDSLAARIAGVESKTDKPVSASDPAAAARVEALEKSLTTLRSELATARGQSEKLASEVKDLKSAPGDVASPDLAAINERIAGIERIARAQAADAQESGKPADDVPLRRVVVASLLDVAVRQGDPFPAALAAAKSLAPDADALKPLDGFAASGVPNAVTLSRELLTLVPKLSPPAPEIQDNAATGTGIVDRLKAGAAKLVRIERTDAVGSDRGAVVARVTAAALRNDFVEARRELKTLAPSDRAAAQAWLDKSDARDAALAASRQFAADAMTALARPGQ
jgi:hypothetical protein